MDEKQLRREAERIIQKAENEAYRVLLRQNAPRNRRDAIQTLAKIIGKGKWLLQLFQISPEVKHVAQMAKLTLEQPFTTWLEDGLGDAELTVYEAGRGPFAGVTSDPALFRAIQNELRRLSGTHLRLVKASEKVAFRYILERL